MADTRTVRTLLQIESDQVSARRLDASIANLRSNLRILAQQAKNADLQIKDAFGRKLAGSVEDSTAALQDVRRELGKVIDEEERLAKAGANAQPADVRGVGRGLTAISRLTGGSSAIGNITALGDDLLDVAETFPKLKASLKDIPAAVREAVNAIGPTGTGLVASLGILTLALKLYSDEQERAKKIADAQIAGLQAYNELVLTNTHEELKTKREAALESLNLAETNAEQSKKLFADLVHDTNQQFGPGVTLLELAAAKVGQAAGAFQAAHDAVGQTESALAEAKAQFDAVDRALANTSDTAKDAASSLSTFHNVLGSFKGAMKDTMDTTAMGAALLKQYDERKAEDEKTIRAESVATAKRYLDTIQKLETDSLEARATAAAKYNDALVAAAERAAEAAENALSKLQETRDNLARDFARGEAEAQRNAQLERLDILLNAQRDEAKLARDHARRLRDIQIEAQRERERLISERDFAALFDQERRVNQQISDANQAYNDQLEEQRIALQQQLDDQIANYLREREARIQKYQQDLADVQAQYVRELQLADKKRREDLIRAQKAYQEDLRLAAQKYTQQLAMAKQTAQAELNLIAQGTQGKLNLEAQYWQVAQQLVASALNNIRSYGSSGTSLTGYGEYANRALGGHLNVGQTSRVEAGERFGGATFPSAGMFTPFRSGMVSVNMTNNITNGTGRETGMMNAFRQIVRQELQGILG